MEYAFSRQETFAFNTDGGTPDAVMITEIRRQGWSLDYIDNVPVAGFCEVCGRPIMDGEDYHHDEEGIMWCKPNCEGE